MNRISEAKVEGLTWQQVKYDFLEHQLTEKSEISCEDTQAIHSQFHDQ